MFRYQSAHIEGAASEKIVRSGHSVQSQPETIDEIKRILAEHLKESKPQSQNVAPLVNWL